ncbi:unnamed protein product [Closterium sp. Yama58-4]|nr:unnamed protein product [Closterium sp. Yama58-4]
MKVALASDEPAFYIPANFPWPLRFKLQADAARSAPCKYEEMTSALPGLCASSSKLTPPVHHVGGSPDMSDELLKVLWWRSQSVRFFLRSPTAYLCHLTNAARHHTYGFRVALSLTAAAAAKSAALETLQGSSSSGGNGGGGGGNGGLGMDEAWLGALADVDGGGEVLSWAGLSEEPYLPRPIVSVHVRQGDKAGEMRLLPLRAFVAAAQHMRRNAPNLNHIWLSTEMQSVVEEAKEQHRDWTFLFTQNPRQEGTMTMHEYEAAVGADVLVGLSFVNLIIASQCDYFVGTLGSNWNRLIDELRCTNGRLFSGYLALNHGQWR